MPDLDAPIGIFDSGVGGLTVARAVIDQLPAEHVVYVGDTAHGPYGPLPIAEIRRHALALGDALMDRGIKALVVACNSASAACLVDIRERYPMPVVEVILPAVRRAVAATRTGRIGVIGTRATIASGAYKDMFAAARDVEVTAVACPRFVDFVERGMTSGRQILGHRAVATSSRCSGRGSTPSCSAARTTRCWPGCVQIVLGPDVTLVSSADETAKDLVRVLMDARPRSATPRARRPRRTSSWPPATPSRSAGSAAASWARRSASVAGLGVAAHLTARVAGSAEPAGRGAR